MSKEKKLKNQSNRNDVSLKTYSDFYKKSSDEVLVQLSVTLEGLDEEQVEESREKHGTNIITKQKKESFIMRFIMAFADPFTIILIALAGVSFFTDVILAEKGAEDPTAPIIVMLLVLVSAVLKFVQESRSSDAAEKLGEMVKITTHVKRKNNTGEEVPLKEVVLGDIIYLAAGDMIPADVRILQAKDLFISQSALTGESEPIEKFPHAIKNHDGSVLELNNIVFMGTNVVSGSATCVAVAVGDNTFLGQISKTLSGKREQTSFELGISSISWLLIKFMAVMVPIVFFVNGFTKGDWLESFLFALSVAVGLTPEMLPTIVTTNLARGSVAMSRKKTIVKNLNSIQNFGAMNILCTDKTGTITEDKIVLEFYMDTKGNVDSRVLRHAFLNSYFQTGLKNLIDVAVINHMDDENIKNLKVEYKKVDEIPFDFQRRRMSVVVEDTKGKSQLITKGAVEEMLSICSFVEIGGKVLPMRDVNREDILETVDNLNNKGLRVIAIAQKSNPPSETKFSTADEKDMVLIGYLAFLDPPKKSSKEAIQALHDHGVEVKVLTGDNDLVTKYVAGSVGLNADKIVLGVDVDKMSDTELKKVIEETSIFAKLSPIQKSRIVTLLKENGNVVGFMGDGINDAPAMKVADVGISVDTAVDIAKESADIILLEKDLMVLEEGVIEGRKTFANMIKYIKMTASSNFGNIFSVLIASAFIPFLPMIPIQLLVLNLIYDVSCITMPWDNVDDDYVKKPKQWESKSVKNFMFWFGPISSIFDILTFAVMYFIICPSVVGGHYNDPNVNKLLFMIVFNSGWFIESLCSQTLVIYLLRSDKMPFVESNPSKQVIISTLLGVIFGTILPFTFIGEGFKMIGLPINYFVFLIIIIALYFVLTTVIKNIYIKKYGEFL